MNQPRREQREAPARLPTPAAAPEAQLRSVFDAMACGVVIADAAGHIVDANEAARQILALTLDELRGRTLPESHRGAIHLDGSAIPLRERPSMRAVSSGQAQRHQVFGITRMDGQRRWLQVETVPMLGDTGQVRSIVSSFVDITERIQAEEALRESEERLRTVVGNLPVLLFVLDRDGIFTMAEGRGLQILGLGPGEVVGRSVYHAYRDAPEILGHVRRALAGEAYSSIDRVGDLVFETWWTPLFDQSGEVNGTVGVAAHVTDRMRMEEALRRSEERFRALVEKAPLGVGITDEQGIFETVNDGYCALYGYAREEMIGRHFTEFLPESVRAETSVGYEQLITAGSDLRTEVDIATKSGEARTMLASVIPITGPDGRPKIASFLVDISDRKQAERRLDHLAHHDTLTGLPNRILFHDRLAQALSHARRHGQLVALLFLDLDGFKAINDMHGHDTGDLLLRAVAQRLRGCIREEDTVARLGGDEFTLLLPNVGSGDNAAAVARKVLDALVDPFPVAVRDLSVTASVGVALYPFHGSDVDALLRCADMAMYRTKGLGKNTYAFYESSS